MLEASNAVLVLIDVQGKLAQTMYAREQLLQNLQRMLKGAQILNLPILWLEQNPRGLGPTVPEIAVLLPEAKPIAKFCFSCCGCAAFVQALEATGRRQVLLIGIETHVCIYQTAADLLARGYHVEVVADAVSSRSPENRALGLERMRILGVGVTSTEMALFELLKMAEGPQFKAILSLVR